MSARSFPALLAALTFMATALVAGTAPAQAHKCGTLFAIDNFQRHPKAPVSARTDKSIYCEAEAYYDSVYSEETEHFQIFYTLSGPHATIPAFIDSLKASLESAFEFEVNHLGMRRPQGRDSTHHYRKPVKDGLYPIEVVEIDFLRDPEVVLKAETCNGCFGVTHPDYEKDLRKSQIFIDNDFLYVPELDAGLDTIEVDGKACPYPVSTESMPNIAYDYYYKDEWAKAIRVTAFHEFYHAIQLQYMDLFKYKTVWTEASAVGIEEAGAPDIDDYFYHIADFMNATGTAINRMSNQYGVSLLFIDLYNHVDKNFDKSVWEQYAKSPSSSLENIFKKGNEGRASLFAPGRNDANVFFEITVPLKDKPGALLSVMQPLAEEGVNIRDIELMKVRENVAGTLLLAFKTQEETARAVKLLRYLGYEVKER